MKPKVTPSLEPAPSKTVRAELYVLYNSTCYTCTCWTHYTKGLSATINCTSGPIRNYTWKNVNKIKISD